MLNLAAVASQWALQIFVVALMMQQGMDGFHTRAALQRTAVLVVPLLVVSGVGILLDAPTVGNALTQVMLVVGFLAVWLLQYTKWAARAPRPAGHAWTRFLIVSHLLYFLYYVLTAGNATNGVGACFEIGAYLFYYLLFAPLLWITLTLDSKQWRSGEALLHRRQAITSSDKVGSLQQVRSVVPWWNGALCVCVCVCVLCVCSHEKGRGWGGYGSKERGVADCVQ